MRAACTQMHQQDKVWSRYSNDKVDIAHELAPVIRTLSKSLPLDQPMTALSIGSSNEPQFRILESAFRGGLYLLDIEKSALDIVKERLARQRTDHVTTIRGNYRRLLGSAAAARHFRHHHLDDQRMTLITMHHSLYYAPRSEWRGLVASVLHTLLAGARGNADDAAAVHAVLMANESDDPTTTTWLYNHFAGEMFGTHNDQDLRELAHEIRHDTEKSSPRQVAVGIKTNTVRFFVDDFEQFMGVIWMILLHPNVHRFEPAQQREVIQYVYNRLWSRRVPLTQRQDHLVIYRGSAAELTS